MKSKIPLLFFVWVLLLQFAHAGEHVDRIGPILSESAKFPGVVVHGLPLEIQTPVGLQSEAPSAKSPGKAFFLSLLVPGLGELYAGSSQKGKIFLAAEAAVWSGFAAFEQYSAWKRRDYEVFAAAHAGVKLDGKDDDFFKNVGIYQNVRSYNADRLHARDMDEVYWDEDLYFWEWDSPESQALFSQLRNSSRKAHRRALNMVGVGVLNRLISAIDAVRSARAFNRKGQGDQTGLSLDFEIGGSLRNPKAMVVVEKSF
ncbi:MAG: hypothetical protein ACE5OR_13335 [bacterium]